MNDAEEIEQACAAAWPAPVARRRGDWLLRAAGGFTARANSALVTGDPGIPVEQALEEVCEFAHAQDIDPVVQAIERSGIERELAANGWRPYTEYARGNEVAVLINRADQADQAEHDEVSVLTEPTPAWWRLAVGTTEPSPAQRHVVTTGAEVGFGFARADDGVAGAVRGALTHARGTGTLVLVSNLAVRDEHRRKGLGTALLDGITRWAAHRGATHRVLQVSVSNSAALALYERRGFTRHHRYRYWVPGEKWKDREP
ncbi:GNAT family N-acetyltransferase [Saccharomonospora sp. NPDC006951]